MERKPNRLPLILIGLAALVLAVVIVARSCGGNTSTTIDSDAFVGVWLREGQVVSGLDPEEEADSMMRDDGNGGFRLFTVYLYLDEDGTGHLNNNGTDMSLTWGAVSDTEATLKVDTAGAGLDEEWPTLTVTIEGVRMRLSGWGYTVWIFTESSQQEIDELAEQDPFSDLLDSMEDAGGGSTTSDSGNGASTASWQTATIDGHVSVQIPSDWTQEKTSDGSYVYCFPSDSNVIYVGLGFEPQSNLTSDEAAQQEACESVLRDVVHMFDEYDVDSQWSGKSDLGFVVAEAEFTGTTHVEETDEDLMSHRAYMAVYVPSSGIYTVDVACFDLDVYSNYLSLLSEIYESVIAVDDIDELDDATYTSSDGDLSYQLPSGWVRDEMSDGLIYFHPDNTEDMRFFINYYSSLKGMTGSVARSALEDLANEEVGGLSNVSFIQQRDLEINGYPALLWEYTATTSDGIEVREGVLYVAAPSGGYEFLFNGRTGVFPDYLPTIQQVFQSVYVN